MMIYFKRYTDRKFIEISKIISFILRHRPEIIGLEIEKMGGWSNVDELITKIKDLGINITRKDLDHIVYNNSKQRFSYDSTGKRIRANYGHTISLNMDYLPDKPPEFLYHGTSTKFFTPIKKLGILSKKRLYVHLAEDEKTAKNADQRHGIPIILQIKALQMYNMGHKFYKAVSGIWVTNAVQPEFVDFSY